MRWLVVLLTLTLAPACTTDSSSPGKEEGAEKAKKSSDKSKKTSSTATKKGGADKAATTKKSASPKGGDPAKGGDKKPPVVYGAKGRVEGELKLSQNSAGEKTKTAAELVLVSGEKEESVKLGGIVGTCAMVEPVSVEDVTALWTVACETATGKANVAIAQQGSALLVARATAGTDAWKPMRKIRLAEGAEVVPKVQ